MIVKDEAAVLERCLKSVEDVADEIVVVDTGSSDNTIAIARRCGAVVVESPWRDDFAQARNVSLDHASSEWILWLDADDSVPTSSLPTLRELKCTSPDAVYGFVVQNRRPGGTGSEFVQARMFPNDPRLRFERRIHEQIMLSALRAGMKLVEKPVVIRHHGYADPRDTKEKARRNIEMLLKECSGGEKDPVTALELADAYYLCGDESEALKWYRTVADSHGLGKHMPVIRSHALLGIGKILVTEEQFEKALDVLRESLSLCPERPDALYSLAVAFEQRGHHTDAFSALRRIIATPSRPLKVSIDFREARLKAFIRLERVLLLLNRREETLNNAREALEHFPERPEISSLLGRALVRGGALLDALHAFEKSLTQRTAGNLDAYLGLCVVYLVAGRRDAARDTMQRIGDAFADNPRYRAFQRVAMGEKEDVQGTIDMARLAGEEEYLKLVYEPLRASGKNPGNSDPP